MKTCFIGRADPKAIDLFLHEERERRSFSPDREKMEDFIIAYEPTEAFSIPITRAQHSLKAVRGATEQNFRAYIETNKIPIVKTHRAGGMIWHGPGQICLAPIIDLQRLKLNLIPYCSLLEKTCIQTLAHFGICALQNHYMAGAQGAWVIEADGTKKKIAFYAAGVRNGIVIHGCMINVSPNLYPISLIDPCNLPGVEVTSMEEVLGKAPDIQDVAQIFMETFVQLITDN